MKLSNRQLVDSVESLIKLNSLKLPVKTSFRLAKLSRCIDVILTDYKRTLEGLQEEYAKKDSEGEKVVIDTLIQFNDKEAFDKAFQELLDCDNELEIKEIPVKMFGTVDIEPSLLYYLDWLIKEQENTKLVS